jgi:hypothetical protein
MVVPGYSTLKGMRTHELPYKARSNVARGQIQDSERRIRLLSGLHC